MHGKEWLREPGKLVATVASPVSRDAMERPEGEGPGRSSTVRGFAKRCGKHATPEGESAVFRVKTH